MSDIDSRQQRLARKAGEKAQLQDAELVRTLQARPDHIPAFDHFLDLAANRSPAAVSERTGRRLAGLLCVQTPPELVFAFGLHPFKLCGGVYAPGQLAGGSLPTLTCPMLRSVLGLMQAGTQWQAPFAGWILPTTCDWVVQFPEMARLCSTPLSGPVHCPELPHLRESEKGRRRWIEEIHDLENFLRRITASPLRPKQLDAAVAACNAARRALLRLHTLRLQRKIAAVWAMLLAETFFWDAPESWTAKLERALDEVEKGPVPPGLSEAGPVFLAGSPVFFPNYKIPLLLEEAGLNPVTDDLCSCRRLLPESMSFSDRSKDGILAALAERHHMGCTCPTFADNSRRLHAITNPADIGTYRGVVFHVLKGCHPYDLESLVLETALKDKGLKFIRIETDYTPEDSRTILTRLEAFAHNL